MTFLIDFHGASSSLRGRDGIARARVRKDGVKATQERLLSSLTSARMRAVRQSSTRPELIVRSIVRTLGYSYRICSPSLPGRPDLSNASRKWALFVNGCFWHHHRDCKLATIPKSNRAFWIDKFRRNRERDRVKTRLLRALGFRTAVVWQCECRDTQTVTRKLRRFLDGI